MTYPVTSVPDEVTRPGVLVPDDSTHTRNRILSAAAKLFSTRGYRGTTIRAISEIVGILSGSLFHYFRSKHEMLSEVMFEAALSMCEKADAVAATCVGPRERLRGLIRLQLECLAGEGTKDFYAVLISEWRELDSPSRPRLTQLRKRYFATWNRVLEDCARPACCVPSRAPPSSHCMAPSIGPTPGTSRPGG